jgi:hypothetical protein
MGSPVPMAWRPPAVAETNIGRPVSGRTLVTAAGALNHLNAVHVRGFASLSVYQGPKLSGSTDVGYRLGEVDHYETAYGIYYVPEAVTLVHLGAWCLAYEHSTHVPSLTVDVVDASGAVVEVGATWTREARDLRGDETLDRGVYKLRPFLCESANRYTTGDEGGASPTPPRRFNLASKAGSVVVFRFSGTYCAIVSAIIQPVPPDSL